MPKQAGSLDHPKCPGQLPLRPSKVRFTKAMMRKSLHGNGGSTGEVLHFVLLVCSLPNDSCWICIVVRKRVNIVFLRMFWSFDPFAICFHDTLLHLSPQKPQNKPRSLLGSSPLTYLWDCLPADTQRHLEYWSITCSVKKRFKGNSKSFRLNLPRKSDFEIMPDYKASKHAKVGDKNPQVHLLRTYQFAPKSLQSLLFTFPAHRTSSQPANEANEPPTWFHQGSAQAHVLLTDKSDETGDSSIGSLARYGETAPSKHNALWKVMLSIT